MKTMMRIFLAILMLLAAADLAEAGEQSVTVTFPAGYSSAPQGHGDLALRIEDGRAGQVLGVDVDGQKLRVSGNLASSLQTLIAADLQGAGFHVVPDDGSVSRKLLIRIDTLQYTEKKTMFKTSADVRAAVVVSMPGKVGATYTFRSHVSDEYAWKPSMQQRGALIGEALAGAVSAAFGEQEVGKALAGN